MATNLGLIKDLLIPMLNAVSGKYKGYPEQWRDFFKEKPSTMNVERIAQLQFTGFASLKGEGMAMSQDPGMREKYLTQAYILAYGLAFTMTHESIQDNQYKTEFPRGVESLKDSASCTKNTVAGLFMTNGFLNTIADGQPLFSAAHPYDGGTFSNLINAGLNETSVNQANILAQNFKNESGLPIVTMMEKLIVSPENQFEAEKLCHSRFEPDNANNGINPVKSLGLFSKGYAVNNFINPTGAASPNWFITTSHPGLVLFQRQKPDYEVNTDGIGTTKNVITSYYERYGFTCYDPRSCIGAPTIP